MDFIIAGSKEDVIRKMESYIAAGVDHFFLRDFSADKEKSFEVLSKEILPYFRK
jgi:alkanesulfonate monooxygenase SsuD/methylene tetrahydromethanopterin reductase-like flavin-dependent oxidoreductase (luciferase family)